MQKDVHFYMTYALSRKAGIGVAQAEIIAWADQFTDELTEAELYGIQTQSAVLGNWCDRQIQMSVIIPFHFVPWMQGENPWMVAPSGEIVTDLVREAVKSEDPYRMGIALHALQDSFSHQGFTGWREDCNSCYPWWYIQSVTPNIGHAEMWPIPDITNARWTDPRTGKNISNPQRVVWCAGACGVLLHLPQGSSLFPTVQITEFVCEPNYDERKQILRELANAPEMRYQDVKAKMLSDDEHLERFITAARQHLSAVLSGIKEKGQLGRAPEDCGGQL